VSGQYSWRPKELRGLSLGEGGLANILADFDALRS
jgi:hypothetical protein